MGSEPTTRVVHVNSPEFRDDPKAVYIGRYVRRAKDVRCHHRSRFANPFPIVGDMKPGDAIRLFEREMRKRLVEGGCGASRDNFLSAREWRYALLMLRGKTLGCWCKPGPCHGDVIVKLIEELVGGGATEAPR